MYYVSTRDKETKIGEAAAIVRGLASDGGLYTPEVFPHIPLNALNSMKDMSYQQRAVYVMGPYLEHFSTSELNRFAGNAYGEQFDHRDVAPVRQVDGTTYCLELWHGPTSAFKDMALQMLPHLLTASLEKCEKQEQICILVATSGDTGKAALEGFRDVEQTRILVFYPEDGVSEVQKLQMATQEGKNVGVCAVRGNFDDAQRGVKDIFGDASLKKELQKQGWSLSSANSINWGRVLPQVVYYVSAYCDLLKQEKIALGDKVNFCVPTGNFGNILAAYYAREMGVPIGKLICASNSNNVLTDFLNTGAYDKNRPFYQTISPSMDILVSSNLERLIFHLTSGDDAQVVRWMAQLNRNGTYTVDEEVRHRLHAVFSAGWCGDPEAKEVIGTLWRDKHYLIDPHTAVAFHVLDQYRRESGDETPTVVVSTASPFKFCGDVLDAIGVAEKKTGVELIEQLQEVTGCPAPAGLAGLRSKEIRFRQAVDAGAMKDTVRNFLE